MSDRFGTVNYCGAGSGGGDAVLAASSSLGASVSVDGGVGAPAPPPHPTTNPSSIRKHKVIRIADFPVVVVGQRLTFARIKSEGWFIHTSELTDHIVVRHGGQIHEGPTESPITTVNVLADGTYGAVSHSELDDSGVEAFELVPVLSGGVVESPCGRESSGHHPAPVVEVAAGDFAEEERVAGAVSDVSEVDFEVSRSEDAFVLCPAGPALDIAEEPGYAHVVGVASALFTSEQAEGECATGCTFVHVHAGWGVSAGAFLRVRGAEESWDCEPRQIPGGGIDGVSYFREVGVRRSPWSEVDAFPDANPLVEVVLFDEGQQLRQHSHELVIIESQVEGPVSAPCNGDVRTVAAAWHGVVDVMVIVAGESNLLEIVLALRAAGGFASLLDSRQEQCHKDRNDCDHDEKFNQRETTPICSLQTASRLFHQKILQRQKRKTTPSTNRQPASLLDRWLKYSRNNAEQAWMSPGSGVHERPKSAGSPKGGT